MNARRIITLILGIILIVTGIYCLMAPALTYMTLGYLIGLNMAADAIGGILLWFERKKEGYADGWALAGAIISFIFGIVLLGSDLMQLAVDMMIVYMAAIWLVVSGIIRIILSTKLRNLKDMQDTDAKYLGRHWWLVLIMGILLVVCGVFSFANPAGLIIAIGINFGLNIIICGFNLIAAAV